MGKALSALVSTSFQNVSAGSRSHSLSETVYFASLSLFGLIRSFHFSSPILRSFPFFLFIFLSLISACPKIALKYYSVKEIFRQAFF